MTTNTNKTTMDVGAWIGIDLGTTNCAAAVYDRTRGGCKWMRIPNIAIHEGEEIVEDGEVEAVMKNQTKIGRIIPSIVLLATEEYINNENMTTTTTKEQQQRNQSSDYKWEDVTHLLRSTILLGKEDQRIFACVGKSALHYTYSQNIKMENNKEKMEDEKQQQTSSSFRNHEQQIIQDATIRNFKRKLLLNVESSTDTSVDIPVIPLGMNQEIRVGAIDIVSILLHSIRINVDEYLSKNIRKKHLQIPGTFPPCLHVSIGVPAAASYVYRQQIQLAAKTAGFIGTVTTTTESTAAAMAYGLSILHHHHQESIQRTNKTESEPSIDKPQCILVFDMGGGTTDVTIAEQKRQQTIHDGGTSSCDNNDQNGIDTTMTDFEVVVTEGNNQLGGNDLDEAIFDHVVSQKIVSRGYRIVDSTRSILLQQCKRAKEILSGNGKFGDNQPAKTSMNVTVTSTSTTRPITTTTTADEVVSVLSQPTLVLRIEITQEEFAYAIAPIVEKARHVIHEAMKRYAIRIEQQQQENSKDMKEDESNINKKEIISIKEVILVGGASRVPAIRNMLREYCRIRSTTNQEGKELFSFKNGKVPKTFVFENELCFSIHPMSAVAQGCAVHAAVSSHTIPFHELKSALMLDTCPYPIGVFTENKKGDINTNKVDKNTRFEYNDDMVDHFVEILPKDSTLPAANYATFFLANLQQPGVTVKAVEKIDGGNDHQQQSLNHTTTNPIKKYNVMGDFTFLLHKLTPKQIDFIIKNHNGMRSVDIGMTLKENGEFIVSIFDPNDPEHVRKRERLIKEKEDAQKVRRSHHTIDNSSNDSNISVDPIVNFNNGNDVPTDNIDEPITTEQILLFIGCVIIFILYAVIKVTFNAETTIQHDSNGKNDVKDISEL